MITHEPAAATQAHKAAVLTKAVLRAGEQLGLTKAALAKILGVSPASISRMPAAKRLDPASKEGELAILFVRMYRSLDSLLGGDPEKCKLWFHAKNRHLNGVPATLVERVFGLMHVIDYLDAMRGHV